MTKITSADYVRAGNELRATANRQTIPYVKGGMSLNGMDCQGLAEYLLMRCGVPEDECNLAGSNAHWRACLWTGTPEACAKQFGAVPAGAWVFIWDGEGGGERARGYADDLGDATHMGVYLGDCVLHASASRECVAESRFEGKTIPNGGWNRVGLPMWIDYGVTSESGAGDGGDAVEDMLDAAPVKPVQPAPVVRVRYAVVSSDNGKPVKLRKEASTKCGMWWEVSSGTRVTVERSKRGWALIRALCTDGAERRAWMMDKYLTYEG